MTSELSGVSDLCPRCLVPSWLNHDVIAQFCHIVVWWGVRMGIPPYILKAPLCTKMHISLHVKCQLVLCNFSKNIFYMLTNFNKISALSGFMKICSEILKIPVSLLIQCPDTKLDQWTSINLKEPVDLGLGAFAKNLCLDWNRILWASPVISTLYVLVIYVLQADNRTSLLFSFLPC